jgi:plasmid stabilization system protein ParE
MKVVFAERARSDIGEIYEHIAQHNRQMPRGGV